MASTGPHADEDATAASATSKQIPGELVLLRGPSSQDERGDMQIPSVRAVGHPLTGERHAEERDGETGPRQTPKAAPRRSPLKCEDREARCRAAD